MRQLLNVSYALQIEGKNDADAQKFKLELEHPPPGWAARRGQVRSTVAPELLTLMGGER